MYDYIELTKSISEFLNFNTLVSSTYFNVSGKYYQYCLQLEYELPLDISFTSQLFGYETLEVNGEFVDIDIPNFEISLDAKDLFFPGMGSSMATLCKKGLILNFTKNILDDSIEFQLTNLLDISDKGYLTQLKMTYDIIDNLPFNFGVYTIELLIDKEIIYSIEFDKYQFTEDPLIYTEIDYHLLQNYFKKN